MCLAITYLVITISLTFLCSCPTFYVKNVLILLANIGPKVPIKFRLIFSPVFVTFGSAARGEIKDEKA